MRLPTTDHTHKIDGNESEITTTNETKIYIRSKERASDILEVIIGEIGQCNPDNEDYYPQKLSSIEKVITLPMHQSQRRKLRRIRQI